MSNTEAELEQIRQLITSEYNVVYHELKGEEQIKMWVALKPEIADKVVKLAQSYTEQQVREARIDELETSYGLTIEEYNARIAELVDKGSYNAR